MSKVEKILNYIKPRNGEILFVKLNPDGSRGEVVRKVKSPCIDDTLEIGLVSTGIAPVSREEDIDETPWKKN